jgi:cell division protein FtsQ
MKEKMIIWADFTKKYILPAALLLVLIILASFADSQQGDQRCQKVKINILDGDKTRFLTDTTITGIITKNGTDEVIGKKASNINLDKIESRLAKNSFVKSVDAHLDMSGDLIIRLEQRKPLIRVFTPMLQQYYLDEEGKHMPLSDKYTAFVPVATPNYTTLPEKKDSVFRAMDSSLFVLAEYLQTDSFARALTGQILIEQDNEFTLIPRLGNFTIFIGNVADLNDKMKRLKSFYRISLPQAGWDRYSRINLKYKNQIIANH